MCSLARVGGRAGYLITPFALIYALDGYTEASLDGGASLSFDTLLDGPQTLKISMPDELHGYFVGAGGEYKFTNALALRLEYRYAHYQGESSSAEFSDSDQGKFCKIKYSVEESASVHTDIDADIQPVRAALVMKLGMP